MGRMKERALARREPMKTAPASSGRAKPNKFAYQLANFVAEIRDEGWYIARAVPSFAGQKLEWTGPFETVETAVLATGRRLATEIADRHARMIETHAIKPGDRLYGLRPTTRPRRNGKAKGAVA